MSAPALSIVDGRFVRGGRPHRLLSGSLHYFRVHPDQWADRLARVAAMGLNTVDTYVAWNFHQPTPGAVDFSGWRDLGRFLSLAAEAGLDVIVRPGPYICAEWDNGGLPAWLTATDGIALRCTDPTFLAAVQRWFDAVVPVIERHQSAHGGPVIAVQVENEYGSYGDDHDYLRSIRSALRDRGICELLYTADGATDLMLDGGSLDGTLAAATFGSGAFDAAALLRRRRPGEPFLCAEFWNGWFDHWGEQHHTRPAADAAGVVADILGSDGSISLYMAHGGTNFGLWSGANFDGERLQPTVTSYDCDAPVAENGALTEKFHAIRRVLLGPDAGPVPAELLAAIPTLPPQHLPVTRHSDLLDAVRVASEPVRSTTPLRVEQLEPTADLVLYRARPVLPSGRTTISIIGLRDRARIHVDGEPVGVLDRTDCRQGVPITGQGRAAELEILVENQGRINYGPHLGEGKGILGGVLVGCRLVHGWQQIPVTLTDLDDGQILPLVAAGTGPAGVAAGAPASAGVGSAEFEVDVPADTFVALPGFAKGFVWINGFLLGRYWEIGPQVTLYVPAPLLRPGTNRVAVLELERFGPAIELRDTPDLGAP